VFNHGLTRCSAHDAVLTQAEVRYLMAQEWARTADDGYGAAPSSGSPSPTESLEPGLAKPNAPIHNCLLDLGERSASEEAKDMATPLFTVPCSRQDQRGPPAEACRLAFRGRTRGKRPLPDSGGGLRASSDEDCLYIDSSSERASLAVSLRCSVPYLPMHRVRTDCCPLDRGALASLDVPPIKTPPPAYLPKRAKSANRRHSLKPCGTGRFGYLLPHLVSNTLSRRS
jgi:hypothetical protein